MLRVPAISIFVLVTLSLRAPCAFAQCEEDTFFPAQAAGGDLFGTAIAVHGELAIIGAQQSNLAGFDRGAAHVFVRAGRQWSEVASLLASDGADNDRLGGAVAFAGGTALVSSTRHGGARGAVYVYEESAGWQETAILVASDAQPADSFGSAVAFTGRTALVGAQQDDAFGSQSGSVYVFERTAGGWNETAELFASDAQAEWNFGSAIAMDGGRAIVGALFADGVASDTGAAYVFELQGGSWIETAKLVARGGHVGDLFGAAVALDGDRVLVGAPGGRAVVAFERIGGGWTETQGIAPADAAALFGGAVGLSGDLSVIGSPRDSEANGSAGAVYVFGRADDSWEQKAKLFAPGAGILWSLGSSVALAADQILAGAPLADALIPATGAVYAFSTVVADIGNYCTGAPNSAGSGASISWRGNVSLGANDFVLTVTGAIPAQSALFFYGAAPIEVPFGDGYRCAGAPLFRLGPPFTLDASGAGSRRLDFTQPPASGGPGEIFAGSTWYAQCWYRDPAGPLGSGFNLSDGLHASFCE